MIKKEETKKKLCKVQKRLDILIEKGLKGENEKVQLLSKKKQDYQEKVNVLEENINKETGLFIKEKGVPDWEN